MQHARTCPPERFTQSYYPISLCTDNETPMQQSCGRYKNGCIFVLPNVTITQLLHKLLSRKHQRHNF